jgi:hypothetical protein
MASGKHGNQLDNQEQDYDVEYPNEPHDLDDDDDDDVDVVDDEYNHYDQDDTVEYDEAAQHSHQDTEPTVTVGTKIPVLITVMHPVMHPSVNGAESIRL